MLSQCVDEWLRVNASCPTCRMSILNDSENLRDLYDDSDIESNDRNEERTSLSTGRLLGGSDNN